MPKGACAYLRQASTLAASMDMTGGALGEDRELVVHRLGLEQVHAGHRHH
eukprot:CAMPEP_0198457172 /NCGR_PEP_ID=MMETSP1453-20131121/27855_1 /TAXON_ID=1461543 ORGANISM="Unidentified sp., Strain RCC701" /NCGR_SAMPLE_ID=MMETSP1453 /ASSEMBLY_ACC=CAM_ASM_001118 /LENGTH=49 /DNA_ID= /DNA_START= /DNA_END= /DNA_ORIENTATION=